MVKKLLSIGVAGIMGLCLFCGCGGNEVEIDTEIGYSEEIYGQYPPEYYPSEYPVKDFIRTQAQLSETLDKYKFVSNSLWNQYDEEFFAENTLLCYIFMFDRSGGSVEAATATVKGKSLNVIINYGVGDLDITSYMAVMLEFRSENVKKVTDIEVELNTNEFEPSVTDRTGETNGSRGELCFVDEAYAKGYLSRNDLRAYAYYSTKNLVFPESLDLETETAIKDAAAEYWRNKEFQPRPETTADEFHIIRFFGVFNDCYIVDMDIDFIHTTTDAEIRWTEIDGIKVKYRWCTTMVWA